MDTVTQHDITFICEHWLLPKDLHTIHSICKDNNKQCFLKSSVDPTVQFCGRPFGGVGFICRNMPGTAYKIIECDSDRLYGIQVFKNQEMVMSVIGVYLPYEDGTKDQTELYINTLDQLQNTLDNCGNAPTVIVGDMNTVLPEEEYLSDNWYTRKPYNKHSAIMFEFLCQNKMCVANFMYDQDVSYTFRRGTVSSYIDHVFINEYVCDKIQECKIVYDCKDNVSDHLALSITIQIPIPMHKPSNDEFDTWIPFPRPNWNDAAYQKMYRKEVSILIETILTTDIDSINNRQSAVDYVNSLYKSLCEVMHTSVKTCNDCVQKQNCYRKPKPWWTKECTITRDRNRLFHHIWKCSGRPKCGVIYECYKGTRKAYRWSCRLAIQDKTKAHFRLINRLHGVKQSSKMWNIIKKSKQSSPAQDAIGLNTLHKYFEEKFSNSPNSTEYIENAKKGVAAKYAVLMETNKHSTFVMSDSRLFKYIKQLKSGSAPGCDGITLEHIKFAMSTNFMAHLCSMFSVCVRYAVVPDLFHEGVLIPILKKSTLDPSQAVNYRPIMVSTTWRNLFWNNAKIILLTALSLALWDREVQIWPLYWPMTLGCCVTRWDLQFTTAV